MTEQDRNPALPVRRPSRPCWPWFLGGVVVLAILANLTGITPYGILMHKDDHVGASNRCSAGKTTLAEARQRSTTLLTEAANAVAAGALLKAPRIDSRHAEGHNLDECFTVTGYQDLPDSIERQAGTAARIADLWTGAGYQKLSRLPSGPWTATSSSLMRQGTADCGSLLRRPQSRHDTPGLT